MNKNIKLLFVLFLISNIGFTQNNKNSVPKIIKIDTLINDKISIRAILVSNDQVYYSADKNRVGKKSLINEAKFERNIKNDTLKFEFRSIAQTNDYIFVLPVGNPAVLYRFSKDLMKKEIVYEEKNLKVFYDSMQFFDNENGIALGDPTNDCLSVIITNDSGKSWRKISCENLPKVEEGEAAFAASNTNVVVKGKKVWLVSGGKKARVFVSNNYGKTWKVYNTPIEQGKSMTGIFTADFYNEKLGIIAGGNYENQNQNYKNKAITTNGGKTWKLIAENSGFGYASCIQFFPNSNGNKLVCVSGTGIYTSNDKGTTWTQISTDNSFYTIRFIDDFSAVLAGKNKMIKVYFSK